MTEVWVDTDFGFDDLWAILLLRRQDVRIAGLSLTYGCATRDCAIANALGARTVFDLNIPLFAGADRPTVRAFETAERILGPTGMRSRGQQLPQPTEIPDLPPALEGLLTWVQRTQDPTLLAIGPLTTVAHLVLHHPEDAQTLSRIVWMGGSNGPGNHSAAAEFNSLADPEAADIVARSGIPLDVIDLEICRQVTFGPADMPDMTQPSADLLGGYLDIALDRGREKMAIYDPIAALAVSAPHMMDFTPMALDVCTTPGADYGATRFTPDLSSTTRLATACPPDTAMVCLAALATQGRSHAP